MDVKATKPKSTAPKSHTKSVSSKPSSVHGNTNVLNNKSTRKGKLGIQFKILTYLLVLGKPAVIDPNGSTSESDEEVQTPKSQVL